MSENGYGALRAHKASSDVTESARTEWSDIIRDARRYRRLQILGAAVHDTSQLANGTVVRFSGLDKIIDKDLAMHPSRGEAEPLPDAPLSTDLSVAEKSALSTSCLNQITPSHQSEGEGV